ncbi:MAG: hypothetical protein IT507_09910, partial [Burkholderiaceae bacterium]|nr:hypothetical protein [Burkholderiaceae bacterium]
VGKSDLARKVWDMQADVKPIFDLSGAAVATGFAVNPLLGVGALVTQFLLRTPIERVMTSRYSVTGPWDDPKVDPLDSSPVNQSEQNNPSEYPSNQKPSVPAPVSGSSSGANAPAAPAVTPGASAPKPASPSLTPGSKSGTAPSTGPDASGAAATPTAPQTLVQQLGG